MSVSLSIIFGVVPERDSAWKPEIAPHAIVMKTNGKSLPGTIGPAAAGELRERRHLQVRVARRCTPTTSSAMVPIFMNEQR